MSRKPNWLRSVKYEPLPISNKEMLRRATERDSTGAGLITICWMTVLGYGLVALLLTGCASTDLLAATNAEVNASMRYQREQGDAWRANCPATGDCEDFALCKARKLLQAGYAPERLSILVGDDRGAPHAVLLVDDRWVLDNLKRKPVFFYQTRMSAYYGCRLDGKLVVYMTGYQPAEPGVLPGSIVAPFRGQVVKCEQAVAELAR